MFSNALMILATSNTPVGPVNKVLSQLKDSEECAVCGSLDDNIDPTFTKNSFNFFKWEVHLVADQGFSEFLKSFKLLVHGDLCQVF